MSTAVSALLIEAPVNRHFAQLHRDSQALTDAVTRYVETGLRRGNGVVVVASREHTELFLTRLREHELDPGAFLKAGQLELHDVVLTLGMFMRNDMPDWEQFRRAAGGILERVRVIDEMVTDPDRIEAVHLQGPAPRDEPVARGVGPEVRQEHAIAGC